jgi:hypothetical protein
MAQIKNKLIENASGATLTGIDDAKLRLKSAGYLRSRNAANSADVNLLRANASDVIEFPSVPQILSGTPTNANDIATVQAVKDIAAGLRDPKDAVRAASTTNVTLPPGGTTLTVDGVTIANGDRVLLAGQTTGTQNGIYDVSGIGSSVVLTRSTDMDASVEVTYGLSTLAVEGTANAGSTWMLTTTGAIVLGTTSLTISKISSGGTTYSGGDMITVTGSVISADLSSTGGLSSTNPGNVAGQLQVNVASATTKINGSNQIEGLKSALESFTLSGTDVTNQFIDLAQVAESAASISLSYQGIEQLNGTDFSTNLTGGVSGKTRLSFLADIATGGAVALVSGDVIKVKYRYL